MVKLIWQNEQFELQAVHIGD